MVAFVRITPLCVPVLLASCQLPVSLVVPSSVVAALNRDQLPPFERVEFDREVQERFGDQVQAVDWYEGEWRQLAGEDLFSEASDGDLLLVKNTQAQSLASTVGLATPTWFDHSGVIQVTEAGTMVIESWPDVRLVAKTPDFASRLYGKVQITPVRQFLERYHHGLILRPAGDGRQRVERALALAEQGITFDPYHDPERPELSCTEFVAQVTGVDLEPIPVSPVPSISNTRVELGWYVSCFVTPDTFLDLPGAAWIGELGRHGSLEEVRALRAMWFEIHRMSQRSGSSMGDWVGYDRFRLFGWRPRVTALLEWAVGLARFSPGGDHEERARILVELANR